MPQMKPLFWLMMLLFTYINFILLMAFINSTPFFSTSSTLNFPTPLAYTKNLSPSWTWKW